jgi:PAS domain S-box-containing protein
MQCYLSKIANYIPGNFYWKNREGIYLGCNDFFLTTAGFNSLTDVIGKADEQLWPLEQAKIIKNYDKRVMESGELLTVYETANLKGEDRFMVSAKVPLRDSNNNIIGIIGNSIDITKLEKAKQKAEKESQAATSYLNNIVACTPGNLYWKDRAGYYLGGNDFMIKAVGLKSKEELLGKTDYELFGVDKADALRKNDHEVMETGRPINIEEMVRLSNGEQRFYLAAKIPLRDEKNNIIGIIGNSLDVTELKTTQSKLREAEERLAGIRSLSASVAHELRTPLSTIQFSISGTKNYLPALVEAYNLAKEHRLKVKPIQSKHLQILLEMLDSIESEVKYAGTIINMTLMNVRQNGISKADFKACSMKACVTEALRRYPFKPDEAKLIEWSNKEDFAFKGDKTLMVHILFNLMKNAFYYIEAAKKGKIKIWYSMDENNNILHFKDTSMGIPDEELPKLFERFYTTTRHGTGLGLAFCKMAMTSFGGSISCKSKYGEFTQFEMYFPKEISKC